MNNSALDEFDLAGLKLTEEQKNQFRKFDTDMDRIVTLLDEFSEDKLSDLLNRVRDLARIKSFDVNKNKIWNKNKFYE
ncbi:hypothetical protein HYH70_15780 [Clostridium botulinum]|uniref:hypothetical protein n=1 Tax=Clostridium botulinum TaxID=1491 RepID=UPI00035BAD8E|nr:hypothetical protein [Clostridium botulinum]EPS48151.1 hypothetical protein CFSAN002367_21167 [Clostridium botulinum CFSAN002367]KON10082.1 hypothetical protein ACP52_08045 [Clostridium botulinum]MBY6907042.1 hypothetical protein [Clostridium botulinum]MBY6928556.1 hypothetical protein [Clostridium botulinum]MBY6956151.1 hypothetical protein [Clostridium botulinum]